jgi:hypothetical protein
VWAPTVWATSPAARWEAGRCHHSRLLVPFGETTEQFTVTFDPATGLLERMESLRYKGADATEKTLWINDVREWGELDGRPVPIVTAVQWGNEDTAWAVLRTEDVVLRRRPSTTCGPRALPTDPAQDREQSVTLSRDGRYGKPAGTARGGCRPGAAAEGSRRRLSTACAAQRQERAAKVTAAR